ncbi:hypothetical protein [Marivirga atlantica]|uniref:Lipoprotein n=1 Tax=Marivirga atlantica TaxID=1548457 RepID=A0A937AG43_9BACT|nr:hypothetical protein [Marivirga atlantica]MBL0764949.1 hypothetical protein [Marivirga atlantica]
MKQLLIFSLLFALFACTSNDKSKSEKLQISDNVISLTDSIIYITSNDQSVYVGKRIFPESNLSNSAAKRHLANSEISSVIEVGDTIFVFLNNNLLISQSNETFPKVNDSLLKYHYPKAYNVEIDDDLPYFAYISSDKDELILMKDRESGEFLWEAAVVTDTILTFMNGIKIGSSKESIFERFNISGVNKSELTIILDNARYPSHIWYEQYKSELNNYEQPSISILLRIENNILTGILMDGWLCFKDSGILLLDKWNDN